MTEEKMFKKCSTRVLRSFHFVWKRTAGFLAAIDLDYIGCYKVEVRNVFRTKHVVGSFQFGKMQ